MTLPSEQREGGPCSHVERVESKAKGQALLLKLDEEKVRGFGNWNPNSHKVHNSRPLVTFISSANLSVAYFCSQLSLLLLMSSREFSCFNPPEKTKRV